MWSTTRIGTGNGSGQLAVSESSALTPPAEAPMTTIEERSMADHIQPARADRADMTTTPGLAKGRKGSAA
ncbi:MAG: hypothetical protein ACHP9T_01225 [Caulobacterales bacterium]|jgi:hypothetical protein